ncbi:MAG: thioredoxin-dependent thiol peroxidase [Alphaproteobacteria bacterium]
MLNEGDIAPDFELPSDSGNTVKLSDLKGKTVVVYFYPKDNTSGCTKQAINFSERLDDFIAAGVEVLGISPDPIKSHQKFREKHGLTITLLADEDKNVISAYDAWGEKKMYGRTYMGVTRSTFLIDHNGKIARIWRKVKIPGHIDEVLAAAQKYTAIS